MSEIALDFWEMNVVQFLFDTGLEMLDTCGSFLSYFTFCQAPNVFTWAEVWTTGRLVEHPGSLLKYHVS